MKTTFWSAATVICVAAALAFVIYESTTSPSGDFGFTASLRVQAPYGFRVLRVEPNSQAARAGIKPGDTLTFGGTLEDQARVVYAPPGSTAIFRVNDARTVRLTSTAASRDLREWLIFAVRLAFLSVALLLAWRRPDERATRSLVAFLTSFGLLIGLQDYVMPTPQLSIIVLQLGGIVLLISSAAFASSFAARFPSGDALPLPAALNRVAQVLAAIDIIAAAALLPLLRTPRDLSLATLPILTVFGLIAAIAVANFVISFIQGAPSERQRRKWIFLLLGVTLVGVFLSVVSQATIGYVAFIDYCTFALLVLMPFGLAYVILRHRVIDVGFVINRAVVYAGVSIVIVGIFMIVETLLAKYVESTNHVTSMTVQMSVALVLGFSIRFVHARVDRFVDTVLFRERHLAEQAIRNFAHDAAYVTDASVLVSRCISTLERYAGARGAGIWVNEGTAYRAAGSTFGDAPDVDENDPAVLAMRARRVSVQLRDCNSRLPGALGFPMIVRGDLLGILVCGAKTADESYAPDEQSALASLAASVGHALDAIEVRDLRRRLEALTATREAPAAF